MRMYDIIDKKKRAQMYYELSERRNSMVSEYVDSLDGSGAETTE